MTVITMRVHSPSGQPLDLASVPMMRYFDPHEGTMPFFSTQDHRAAPMREVPLTEVSAWLDAAGLSRMAEADGAISGLRAMLCTLTLPRWDKVANLRDLPQSVLHDLLPKVKDATKAFGTDLMTIAQVQDRWTGTTETQNHPQFIERMRRVTAFMEAADALAEILPPAAPREVKWWHDDAKWLANYLVEVGRELSIDIGLTRADRSGAKFIAFALRGLSIDGNVTPSAVAKLLQRAQTTDGSELSA